MLCPVCNQALRDLFALSLHVEERHPDDLHRVTAVVIDRPLPIFEMDIDRIHVSRIAATKTAKAAA